MSKARELTLSCTAPVPTFFSTAALKTCTQLSLPWSSAWASDEMRSSSREASPMAAWLACRHRARQDSGRSLLHCRHTSATVMPCMRHQSAAALGTSTAAEDHTDPHLQSPLCGPQLCQPVSPALHCGALASSRAFAPGVLGGAGPPAAARAALQAGRLLPSIALTWLAHRHRWLVEAAAAVSGGHEGSSGPALAERGAQAAFWGGAPHPCGQLAMAQPCKKEAALPQ